MKLMNYPRRVMRDFDIPAPRWITSLATIALMFLLTLATVAPSIAQENRSDVQPLADLYGMTPSGPYVDKYGQ